MSIINQYRIAITVYYPEGHADEGQPYSGAYVEFKNSGNTIVLTELGTTARYTAANAPAGKYSLWVDGINSNQSFPVGAGDVAGLGYNNEKFYVSSESTIEHKTPEEVAALLGLSNVNPIGIEKTGFPIDDNDCKITYIEANRQLFINPYAASFSFFVLGVKFIKNATQDSAIWDDTEGKKYFAYNDLAQLFVLNSFSYDLVLKYAYCANIYWDADNKKVLYATNQKHTDQLSGRQIQIDDKLNGASYVSGLNPNLTTEGTGDNNSDAWIGINSGETIDAGIINEIPLRADNAGYKIFWNVDDKLRMLKQSQFPVSTDIDHGIGSTGRLVYNDIEATDGQYIKTVPNNNFVLAHIFALQDLDLTERQIVIMGEQVYTTANNAREGALNEMPRLIGRYNQLGIGGDAVPLYSIIYQTSNNYTNSCKARTREYEAGADFVDFRRNPLTGATGGTSDITVMKLDDTEPNDYVTPKDDRGFKTTVGDATQFEVINRLKGTGFKQTMNYEDNLYSEAVFAADGIVLGGLDGSTEFEPLTRSFRILNRFWESDVSLETTGEAGAVGGKLNINKDRAQINVPIRTTDSNEGLKLELNQYSADEYLKFYSFNNGDQIGINTDAPNGIDIFAKLSAYDIHSNGEITGSAGISLVGGGSFGGDVKIEAEFTVGKRVSGSYKKMSVFGNANIGLGGAYSNCLAVESKANSAVFKTAYNGQANVVSFGVSGTSLLMYFTDSAGVARYSTFASSTVIT